MRLLPGSLRTVRPDTHCGPAAEVPGAVRKCAGAPPTSKRSMPSAVNLGGGPTGVSQGDWHPRKIVMTAEEEEAFDAFVRARSECFLRVSVLLTGSLPEGEDLLQASLVRLSWVWPRGARSWTSTGVRHRHATHRRTHRAISPLPESPGPAGHPQSPAGREPSCSARRRGTRSSAACWTYQLPVAAFHRLRHSRHQMVARSIARCASLAAQCRVQFSEQVVSRSRRAISEPLTQAN
jgi:hypothetical protein